MLPPTAICRNKVKDKIQAEIEILLRQRVLCCDIDKEDCHSSPELCYDNDQGREERSYVATIFPLS